MATRRHLLAFALLAVINSGIAVDKINNKAVSKIQKGNVKEIGNYDYIAWRVAPKKKVWLALELFLWHQPISKVQTSSATFF